mmetsp:Transcript_8325/g.18133  ORF Transcript_8325/g.18133 Transcript_8325/m.18133 type:complete len:567 (-) Transcript_8325:227-1927(-)
MPGSRLSGVVRSEFLHFRPSLTCYVTRRSISSHKSQVYALLNFSRTATSETPSLHRDCDINEIRNLYSGEIIERRPFVGREEAMATVGILSERQSKWGALPLEERVARIRDGVAYINEHRKQVANDIVATVGKPLSQAESEVAASVKKMQYLCESADEALAPRMSTGQRGEIYETHRVPKGIVDIVAPWNFPMFTALNGAIPALLAGNGVILKHQSVPRIGDWFARAFGTEGVSRAPLEHLHIDVPTSSWLAASAAPIAHRVFTGSVRGGREVSQSISARAANLSLATPFVATSLELGGCDAAYVHADLGSEAAARALNSCARFIVQLGRLSNTGQSCCAVKRAILHSAAYDAWCALATEEMSKFVAGDPARRETTLGPLYGGGAACEALLELVEDALALGARVVVGGEDVSALSHSARRERCVFQERSGHFFRPTLLLDAKPPMRCLREESFGPLLPVQRLDTPSVGQPDEVRFAVEAVGDTPFALTASVWTLDSLFADAFVREVKTGTCYVNWCNDVHPQLVWSGSGFSGNGAGALGLEGFRCLSNTKSVLRSSLLKPISPQKQ